MRQRIITGSLAALFFLAMVFAGGAGFAIVITLMALVGYYEFIRLNGAKGGELCSLIGFAGVLCLVAPWEVLPGWQGIPQQTVIWLLLFAFTALTVFTQNRTSLDAVAIQFFGVVYIGFGFHYMAYTRLMDNGLFWSLLLFGCIWLTDVGAYFSGKKFGKRPLWPSISPNKTVEGSLGGMIISVLTAVVFSLLSPELLSIQEAVAIGMIVSVIGQLGDLIQSAYKRIRNVKDTGTLLPGHGGILDRTDSWIIVFPFIQLLGLLP